jgi:hypothetical protein
MNALTLVQTSPASNPDTNLIKVAVSGAYVSGTGDVLPLNAIADPLTLNQVVSNNIATAPPPVSPEVFGYTPGYSAQVERVVTGVGLAQTTAFYLRWTVATTGLELASGAYPVAFATFEIFLRMLCQTVQQ